jgi:hypothetical protein
MDGVLLLPVSPFASLIPPSVRPFDFIAFFFASRHLIVVVVVAVVTADVIVVVLMFLSFMFFNYLSLESPRPSSTPFLKVSAYLGATGQARVPARGLPIPLPC